MITTALTCLVEACARRALAVAFVALIMTVALTGYVATSLGISSDLLALIDPNLPWRQRAAAFDEAFPRQVQQLVVVLDGEDLDKVDDGAARLAERLAARPDLFKTVYRPDGGSFFERHGLLFLPLDEFTAVTERIVEAQPLIGALAQDPTLRGLFDTLNLALGGIARGEADIDSLAPALDAITETANAVLSGNPRPLAWRTLMTGREPSPEERQRMILIQPVLDLTSLEPGRAASAAIRDIAASLGFAEQGIRVRLTGSVALADEELATVAEGMTLATVLSFVLVGLLLYLALRSLRLIGAVLATLVGGLVATAAFATVAVGSLNLISVAFGVMFVGLAVDFSIQFCVRYRDERYRTGDLWSALKATALGLAGPISLAAVATAVGFWSFIPTPYIGVSELGLIAGSGMIIALVLNFTMLPALIGLVRPAGEKEAVGFAWAAPLDAFLLRQRRSIAFAALALAVIAVGLATQLRFDANPLNLRDPKTESVSTLLDLMADPMIASETINVLTPSAATAADLAAKLEALPEVAQAVSINSFVPEKQDEKLAILEDLALLLGPALMPPRTTSVPSPQANLAAIAAAAEKLEALGTEGPVSGAAAALRAVLARGEGILAPLQTALLSGFGHQLARLRLALEAQKITIDRLPRDLVENWVAADGRARIELFSTGDTRQSETIARFVAAVQRVAPDAIGAAVVDYEAGRMIVQAFIMASILAVVAITALLAVVLRRLWDVAMTLAPLLLASVLTLATCVAIDMPINFANIIALPLLLGIGVAFSIYFVMNWRAGATAPLQSPTARAILFSGLTTGSAFGSLAASSHPGTASMGMLLAIALFYMLACTLLVLPALLGPVRSAPASAGSRQPAKQSRPARK